MHPHHIRIALFLLGVDPRDKDAPDLPTQLDTAAQTVGMSFSWYCEEDQIKDRGYTFGLLGAALFPYAEAYVPALYSTAHAIGRGMRAKLELPIDIAAGDRRLARPVQFGKGSDAIVVPVGHVVRILKPVHERPDGNRYALVRWAGCLMLLPEPDTRLEPLEDLTPEPSRWDILRQIFEGEDPGVWGEDAAILEVLRESVPTAVLRDIQTARTAYLRDWDCTIPWVTERINMMRVWKKAQGEDFQQRFLSLPEGIQASCTREV